MAGRTDAGGVGADWSAGGEGASLSAQPRRTLLRQAREAQNIGGDPEEGALASSQLGQTLQKGGKSHADAGKASTFDPRLL
eukprot:4327793-Heterocapsa_arctica.AAC.1